MSFSRPIQRYHSLVDLIWPNGGTFNPEACVLLFIYQIFVVSSKCFYCLSISCRKTVLCVGSSTCSQLMFYNLPILFGKTVLYVLGQAYCTVFSIFIYFVWEDCAVCWAQHIFFYLYILCGKTVLCIRPSIFSIIYLFCVGRLCCLLGPAYVLLFIYFVWEDCAVCWAQNLFYYLSILCGKTVLVVGPSICSIIYLFCVGRL
jgi:hypothetical protein